jgi:hypothetical protein
MKALIFSNWHTMRWIRLAIAVFLLQQAIQYREVMLGFISLFFFTQALFNMGCGASGCAVPNNKKQKK